MWGSNTRPREKESLALPTEVTGLMLNAVILLRPTGAWLLCWCSSIIQDSDSCGPGAIPGRGNDFFLQFGSKNVYLLLLGDRKGG